MDALCRNCEWLSLLNENVRFNLSQENKEILNTLARSGYDLKDFGYCQVRGFIESLLAFKPCDYWSCNLEE